MPELPEVETVVRGLRQTVLGQTIEDLSLNAPPASVFVSASFGDESLPNIIIGRRITSVDRRGKNILISLTGKMTLWVHLKMTGHFYYRERSTPLDKHDLVVFYLRPENRAPGKMSLRFNDYRRFGRLRLFYNRELWQQDGLKELGPEPLELTRGDFVLLCKSAKRMIKPALLDQSFIAGLGNIYADESLYASRIHPTRVTSSLSTPKLVELHGQIRRLLKMAIRKMGTSVDSFSGVNGNPGEFQKYLKVYGNEGNPCLRCGRLIVRQRIGARSAHFCPRCQRA
ncbi:MAG: DNA-formamidopyrimidine glycosylase [Candidatus Zixiibacteriota bacterium]|nr:MAG: DNA-formamidopyrimidine glycosylase [candidate division Zixibacteria bacterium]